MFKSEWAACCHVDAAGVSKGSDVMRGVELAEHLSHSLQLDLGLVFGCSGVLKLLAPRLAVTAVAEYRIVPVWTAGPVAVLLIGTELGLGAAFVVGRLVPVAWCWPGRRCWPWSLP
jgi:methylamine utilization protein MauE